MEKYGGRLIFTARDEDGLLEVVDTQGFVVSILDQMRFKALSQ